MGDDVGANGVQLDVTVAQQQVFVVVHQARLVAPFPQRAAAAVGVVDVLHVTPADGLHHAREAVRLARGGEQMHVVGHEHEGVNVAAVLVGALLQAVEIEAVVGLRGEGDLPVVAALHDVLRQAGEVQARAAGIFSSQ